MYSRDITEYTFCIQNYKTLWSILQLKFSEILNFLISFLRKYFFNISAKSKTTEVISLHYSLRYPVKTNWTNKILRTNYLSFLFIIFHLKNLNMISAVTGPILTKLFGPNFVGIMIFVNLNVLGQTQIFLDLKFFQT